MATISEPGAILWDGRPSYLLIKAGIVQCRKYSLFQGNSGYDGDETAWPTLIIVMAVTSDFRAEMDGAMAGAGTGI